MLHVNQGLPKATAHHHDTVAEARLCEAEWLYQEAQAQAEIAAEQGYERHLEDAGWADKFRDEQAAQAAGFPSLAIYQEWVHEGELELEASY